ncbi:MAG: iron ABC transporter permease [Bacteroidaceae bacterium]|nr:iron ABC transporter permease [Bacteroidaceae bacterium]MBR3547947.1 iron ABC transporter permease [Bacteroidaceae bacterium]MBR4527087.1 iron ABC transporter permease [Bacteroidaceae bacterium]
MRQSSIMILLVLCIPFFAFLNLTIGSVEIPLSEVFNILLGRESDSVVWSNIVLHTRLPQTLTAIACGAGLSVAGLEMQTVFHNPLAGPSVLGISSAASLGVAFVVLLNGTIGGGIMTQFGFFGNTALTLAAMMGAMGVMSIIVFLSQRVRNNVTLLIVGVLIGYIASAIIGVLKFFSSEEDIRAYVIWGLGSFARVTGGQVYVFVGLMAVVLPFTFLLVKPLNMLLLGERYAVNLGLNLRRARLFIILSASVLIAIVTAYCGPIMFLGLAVPHICRGLFHTSDHRVLLPASLFAGASLALVCNLVARLPGFEGALPINSVTSLIGAPVALYVLLRKK